MKQSQHYLNVGSLARAALGLCAMAASGCDEPPARAPSAVSTQPEAEAPVNNAERIRAMLAQESAPQPMRGVQIYGGLGSAQIEGVAAPEVQCSVEGETWKCTIKTKLALGSDGAQPEVTCVTFDGSARFGQSLANIKKLSQLMDQPTLQVTPLASGVEVSVAPDYLTKVNNQTVFGSAKIAAFYTQNISALCIETTAGRKATFTRVTRGFFQSLQYRATAGKATLLMLASATRTSENVASFTVDSVQPPRDLLGTQEIHYSIGMRTSGETWYPNEVVHITYRDARGLFERREETIVYAPDKQLTYLTKRLENGDWRIKVEWNNKSNAIEVKPKAPLYSPLWWAAYSKRIASGEVASTDFVDTSINDDDEADFSKIQISRKSSGQLLRLELSPRKLAAEAQKTAGPEELTLDEDGFVKRHVRVNSVTELVYKAGALPAAALGLGAAVPPTAAAPAAAGSDSQSR